MIREGNLQSHQWLKDLYRIREKWSTTFNKNCFNLGILSTQRSESSNYVFHGISKVEKVIKTWHRNERDENFRCSQTTIQPYIKSSPILKQAANFYSRKLYTFFEEEFLHGLGGLCIDHSSPDLSTFFIKNIDHSIDSHKWTVMFNSSEGTI
ncbi:Protein FAR1-RELATED SEQUENCE 9 [Dendrobium catenatum]|uniref:Protein FAR1-RELATED SEQUENCE n=1 Tax=Dendrobium catenatum TaxID=906689 RepID=A0A2I0VIZ1_9ASPA|nr:Protein FAR1-RELATED SEQUENCE 9 [Dendrobium catenatum]